MFSRIERSHPDAFVPRVHQVAMFEVDSAHVFVRHAHIRNHDADVADWYLDHRHLLDLHEPWIEVPCAGQQNLLLQTATTAPIQKRLRILEIVMPRDGRAGDLARLDRYSV